MVRFLLPMYIGIEVAVVLLALAIAVWGFFRWDRRYHGTSGGDAYQRTDETFKDPTTGRMMTVFFDPKTGSRQYRESA